MKWCFLDNYDKHENGRIWIMWDDQTVDIKLVSMSDQYIHCEIYELDREHIQWTTCIYAHNTFEQRRTLWKNIEQITLQQTGPWMVIGDFNNVLTLNDIIGGHLVMRSGYADLEDMMNVTSLFEKDMVGDYFTWSNKHVHGVIYSRTDRAICNPDWYQKFPNTQINVMEPGVSDHTPLLSQISVPRKRTRK